jgi:hypothetical protein
MDLMNLTKVVYVDADGEPCDPQDAVWSVRGNLRTSKVARPQVFLNGEWAELKQAVKK